MGLGDHVKLTPLLGRSAPGRKSSFERLRFFGNFSSSSSAQKILFAFVLGVAATLMIENVIVALISPSGTSSSSVSLQHADDALPFIVESFDRTDSWVISVRERTPIHEYVNAVREAIQSGDVDATQIPLLHKWESYFTPYHRHLKKFRNKPVVVLEIGVQSGGSALMWRHYFGPRITYVGVDVNPSALQFDNGDWSRIIIGDQADPSFWQHLVATHPEIFGKMGTDASLPTFDVIIDDGGHTMTQQRTTFYKTFFSMLKPGGVYICEDLATSYKSMFGGVREATALFYPQVLEKTMMGLAQQFPDWLNAIFIDGNLAGRKPSILLDNVRGANAFADAAESVSFYPQMVFVEKKLRTEDSSAPPRAAGTLMLGKRKLPYKRAKSWDGVSFPMTTFYDSLNRAIGGVGGV